MIQNSIPYEYDLSKHTDIHINKSLKTGRFIPSNLQERIDHPVGEIQRTGALNDERQYMRFCASVYGLHAPLTLARERVLVSQCRRLPPFRSSLLGLDLSMGTEDHISFEDYLNIEVPDATKDRQSIQYLMERRLNMSTL